MTGRSGVQLPQGPLDINRFWQDWNINEIESRAISATEKAISFLFDNVAREDLRAIYIKGSFVRRELLPKSDVDIVPITKENSIVTKIRELQETFGQQYAPAELRPLSIQELKTGKRINGEPGNPIDLLERRDKIELVWGEDLKDEEFPLRSLEKRLRSYEAAFSDQFFSNYEKGVFSEKQLAKATFWLIDIRMRAQGITPPLRWEDMIVKLPENHVGKLAWNIRMGKKEPEFYEKLKEYWREGKL